MDIATLILNLLNGLSVATDIYVQIEQLKAKVEAMQAEGRDPTTEEWDALLTSIDVDKARLDAADKRLNP